MAKDYINFTEFPLVISLVCLGFKIESFNQNPKNYGRIEFVFSKNKTIEKTINDYWNGKLLIDPKKFWSISRELKSRTRSLK